MEGFGYKLGKSKMAYRHNNNYPYRHNNNYSSNANNLEQRVRDALDPNLALPIKRVRALQRRDNDYKRP